MATTSDRTQSPQSGRRLVRALVGITASLSLLVAAASAYGYVAYNKAQAGVSSFPIVRESSGVQHHFGPCVNNICNYLILGSDSRAGLTPQELIQFGTNAAIGGSTRSDVIMLVHTDPKLKKAIILSFPRDLWVNIPGMGQNKINSAFSQGLNHGGPQLVAKTVEELTGLKINHVLYVDLAGFQGIVDTLQGVTMCIPANLADPTTGRVQDPLTGLNLAPGCQRLNGYQALAYVRTRHLPCDFIPDFSRIGRQQQFLRAVLNRLLSTSEIAKAPSLIAPIAHNLVTDPGFKLADIIYLVKQLQGISTGAVEFRAVPGTPTVVYPSWSPSGLDIVQMDPVDQQIFARIRQGKPLDNLGLALAGTATSEANIVVPVVDHNAGTLANQVETVLSNSGFDISPGIVSYTDFGAMIKGSAIVYRPGAGPFEEAQVVRKYFANLPLVQAPKGALPGSAVAVFVTGSYQVQPVGTGGNTSGCVPAGP
jgi:LCP family protein required for cell wall assembly